jgi:hypothetical protein
MTMLQPLASTRACCWTEEKTAATVGSGKLWPVVGGCVAQAHMTVWAGANHYFNVLLKECIGMEPTAAIPADSDVVLSSSDGESV